MMKELQYPFDNQMILRKRKFYKEQLLTESEFVSKKIAILGGSTTHDIKEILELFLLNYGIKPTFYESEYGQFYQDAIFGNDILDTFSPDIIYIHTSNRNILRFPEMAQSYDEVEEVLQQEYDRYETVWNKLEEKFKCPIIQNNFEFLNYRLLGNSDAYDFHGRTNFITRLNSKFYEYAQKSEKVYINDINYLSADYGLHLWSDPSYWYRYKYALCFDAIPILAYNVANIIKAILGKNKKALAIDLDNTLWGGIVGDDGVENLVIGNETPKGQAYTEFQQYLQSLKNNGIILNIISKNERQNALDGLAHPQMLLSKDDFLVIKANWEPKSINLKEMATELSLGIDSFVFLDDNPAERDIVCNQLDGVGVPELSRVENYIYEIDRAGYFETIRISKDDLNKTQMYKENYERKNYQSTFASYDEYLSSLEMKAEIEAFQAVHLSRIAQLTNKSNQFNTTTLRCTKEELEEISTNKNYITLYGRLWDKFGDNGIVAVTVGKIENGCLNLILWLMSCRVLKRDMEYAMLDEVVKLCKQHSIHTVRGYYYPTQKNGMVKSLYEKFGFQKISEDSAGNTEWEMQINDYKQKNKFIEIRRTENE